tara:strand:+ start:144 stop:524 length:381 start_codon:yes stop_codon:yes gene_type:complete
MRKAFVAVKKILLICCLLFAVPANAGTIETSLPLCIKLHRTLFQSALGGAPYEHLRKIINSIYDDDIRVGAAEEVLFGMMLEVYRELGKAKLTAEFPNPKFLNNSALKRSEDLACTDFYIKVFWLN